MKYGKLKNGKVEYAGKVIRLDDGSVVVAPKETDLLAAHYLPVVDEPPATDDAHYAAPAGWVEQDGAIRRIYDIRERPPKPPRRWSRLSIKTALAQARMLAAARTYLSGVEVATGYTAWEALTDCDYVEEGYPNVARWSAILDGAAAAFGKERADIDAFMDSIPTE